MRVEILQMVKAKYKKESEEDLQLLECSDFYLLNDDYVGLIDYFTFIL